jgi:DDB1- and CUL4-associated factor 4
MSGSDLDVNQSLVFTGARNGTIRRFDTRTRARDQILLGEAFTKPPNSITYLNIVRDWQLLVSTMRGAVRCSWSLGASG